MAPSEYATAGPGKLKLKGVKDSKIDKRKKKKPSSKPKDETSGNGGDAGFQDKSVMLKNLEDEDKQMAKEERKRLDLDTGAGVEDGAEEPIIKTEAERRYEEQRRKRVCQSLLESIQS